MAKKKISQLFTLKEKRRKEFFWVLGVIFASIIILWPLLRSGFIETDDGNWMIIRLSAFYQSLAEGQFPVRFLGRLNYSYGYPVSNFLYPGFLYLGSIIHATSVPFVETVKLIFILSVTLGGVSTFLFLRYFFPESTSFLGALLFYLSPYLSYDIYKRGSVGEVLAIGLAAFSLYLIEANKTFLFTFVFAFLLISHNSLAVLFMVLLAGYILVRKRMSLLWNMVLAIGMTAFFWFPALYERRFVIFDQVVISNPIDQFLPVTYLGLTGVLAILWTLKNRKTETGIAKYFAGVSVVAAVLSTTLSLWLWEHTKLTQFFQFPYRMISVTLLTLPYLVARTIVMIKAHEKYVVLLVLLGVTVLDIYKPLITLPRTFYPESYYSTNEATTTVGNEYMPRWVKHPPTERVGVQVEFIEGRGAFIPWGFSTQKIRGTLTAIDPGVVQINTIYYPGWGVTIDGQPVPIDFDNPRGTIRFRVDPGTHDFMAEFRETVPRFVATVLSGTVVIMYAAASLIRFFRGKPFRFNI